MELSPLTITMDPTVELVLPNAKHAPITTLAKLVKVDIPLKEDFVLIIVKTITILMP